MAEPIKGRASRTKGQKWVNVGVPETLHDTVKARADEQGISIALFVRNALDAALERKPEPTPIPLESRQ